MKQQINVRHLVLGNILCHYPNDKVEQNLTTEADLKNDLGLNKTDVDELALFIGNDLQSQGLPAFTPHQIAGWQTVDDIIKTIMGNATPIIGI